MDAAIELFPLPRVRSNPEAQTASRDFTIKIGQAQSSQPIFMVDDAATLAHEARLPSTMNGSNRGAVAPRWMSPNGAAADGQPLPRLPPIWNGANLACYRRWLPISERRPVTALVPILKDEDHEQSVPSEWRSTLQEIAEALTDENFNLRDLTDVDPLDDATAAGIARNISDYGCTLTPLPHASWDTSVCQWQLDYWEVLVDLFTVEEGRSDLVLHVHVFEQMAGFVFKVHLVYVP
jgi:hypothetical protein